MYSIKKALKKEKAKLNRNYFVSYFLMILILYLTYVAVNLNLVEGWKVYFTIFYAFIIEVILFINILKMYSESKFSIQVDLDKVKIYQPFKGTITFQTSKVVYVDVLSKKDSFDLVIFLKSKRAKRFIRLTKEDEMFKKAYDFLYQKYGEDEFCYYIVKNGGAKKYFYLYKLYKNCFEAEFSRKAMEYVKLFLQEYNLS
ncbi:hypothetical protein SAMN05660865_00078 [Caloramator fervidus]|uniref:Transmembrane protein n=1 Tax=Caloramator fervidus TaxID=29344 RepID=A0A1H5RLC2_9CLOT|nr:hypothetical protein [Caloramator fervidus]SEF38904.1 hypothetical protein SAMN05660865_00078 [Caloramator fervidus]